jgi:hypothetical protein
MKTSLINSSACLYCRSEMDVATGDGSPKAGALIVCLECGELLVFREDLSLRALTSSELRSVRADHALVAEMKKTICTVRSWMVH